MLSLMRVLAAATLVAVLSVVPRADACSCGSPRLERVVVPGDGAKGFPVDGTIRVFLTAFPEPLRLALAQEYRLADAEGSVVPLDASVVATRLDLKPRTSLRPATRYVLEQLHAFDAGGVRLDDTQRAAAVHDNVPGLMRAWFATIAFETSATPSAARPSSKLAISDAEVEFAYGGGDCGPAIGLGVSFGLPAAITATDTIELDVRADGMPATIVDTLPAAGATLAGAGDMACDPDPVTISAEGGIRARLRVVDAAGATVGESPWESAGGWLHWPLTAQWHAGRRSQGGGGVRVDVSVSEWMSPPVITALPTAPPPPAGCPNGLEVVSRNDRSLRSGQWRNEQQPTLVSDGRRGLVALTGPRDGSTTRLYGIDPRGKGTVLRDGLRGFPEATAVGAGGPLLVTHQLASVEKQEWTLHALGPVGEDRWSAGLPAPGLVGGPRVAAGGGLVLVTWRSGDRPDPRLVWALFRESDGQAVGTATSAHAVSPDGAAAAAWIDDHFLIAWPDGSHGARGTLRVGTLSPTGVMGAPSTLPVVADGAIDLAPAGGSIGMVSGRDGVIEWTLLSPSGAVELGPIAASAGIGGANHRRPRVTFRDGLFAVAWETEPGYDVHAALIDASGAVSAVASLADGAPASAPIVIAMPDRTFLATYVMAMQGYTEVATLRCRAEAPTAVPQQIRLP